jgi:NADH-quinone oxidoreductase subunit K
MTGDCERYLAVAAVLFVLGAIGFLTRRNLIVMMLSAEMMLHGVSLTLVTFSRLHNNLEGQAFTIFILTVAACEAGLALALILALYQRTKSLDVELWTSIRERDLPEPTPAEERRTAVDLPEPQSFPALTPAGRAPDIRSSGERIDEGDSRSSHSSTPSRRGEPVQGTPVR